MDSTPTVNPLLSQTAEEFFQGTDQFIASRIAPVFQSGIQSGNYYVNEIENLVSTPDNLERAPGSPYKQATTRLSSDSFNTVDRGIEVPVDDSQRAKYRDGWDADRAAVEKGVRTILTEREIRLAALAVTATEQSMTALDGTNGALFLGEVEAEIDEIRLATGIKPNTLVLPIQEWVAHLKHDTYLLGRIKNTGLNTTMAEVTAMALADILDLEQVIIPQALKATTKDGQAVTTTSIWPAATGFLLYAPPSGAALDAPSAYRTFSWTEESTDFVVETYRDEKIRSDIHRVRAYDDIKATSTVLIRELTGL